MITTNLAVIAAICGNFWQESTVNPGIWENLTVNAPGYGLGQWTDSPGVVSRRTALFNWLSAHGYPQDSGQGQLEFLVYENVWLGNGAGYTSVYNSLTDFLTTTDQNIQNLTGEFMHQWEGIDDGTLSVRVSFAYDALALFLNDPGTRSPWVSGNFYNSRQTALDNCLNILDFFTGALPQPTDEEILALVSLVLKRRKQGGGLIVF